MNSPNTGGVDRQGASRLEVTRTAGGDDNGDDVVVRVTFGTRSSRLGGGHKQVGDPNRGTDLDDDEVFEGLVIELTPRQRRFVEVAAWTLADDVYDAIEDFRRHPDLHRRPEEAAHGISILSEFPPLTWKQSASWWRQQARCFDDLALEAQAGIDPDPVCTGEEMALHLVLGRARAMATDESDRRMDLVGDIAAHDNDNDWEGPLDFLFQDHDVLTLFDNDTKPHPGAVNLVPAEWFTPFVDIESRRPDRGFRR
ncbi:hypothetical protein AB0P23_24170 [Rhodococcus sp. NPDC077669]|uniref:hypothetical protein n=1 Tax=Rhodococcus sp. NPDC077669 TaxID=3155174 RepID=UPI0034458F18